MIFVKDVELKKTRFFEAANYSIIFNKINRMKKYKKILEMKYMEMIL